MNKKTEQGIQEVIRKCREKNNFDPIKSRMCVINEEFRQGFELMQKYPKSVTIFGSARLPEENPYAQKATELSRRLSQKGFAVITGGGHGIMGAAHKGAKLEGGDAIGMNIELPFEQTMNPYITDAIEFHHFFSRKVILAYSAEAYIYFPGGFGTLDEFFELLTLKQTKKIPPVPIILFGSDFWQPLEKFFREILLEKNQTISKEDLSLYTITDDVDEIVEIVEKSPIRSEHPENKKSSFYQEKKED